MASAVGVPPQRAAAALGGAHRSLLPSILAALLVLGVAAPTAAARTTAADGGERSSPAPVVSTAAVIDTTATSTDTVDTAGLVAGAIRYVTAWTSIRTASDAGASVEVTVGPRYKVVLTGTTARDDGVVWLRVTWTSPSRHGTGWIRAATTSATRPAGTAAEASVNALSTTLSSYLAGYGSRMGVEVLDVTHSVVYTANAAGTFITASSVKVPIMLAVMARAESAGRSLTAGERTLLTSMIERSDNNAASVLYRAIGGKAGLAAWARRFGISGLVPEGAGIGWGYSTIHPSTTVTILERLRTGRLTNAADRSYALYLMRHVISSQRFGVGTGSPVGATVAMKDGWVVGPDGRWAVNSSGIVTSGGVTYVISVYTRGDLSFSAGASIVTHVASVIGAALT